MAPRKKIMRQEIGFHATGSHTILSTLNLNNIHVRVRDNREKRYESSSVVTTLNVPLFLARLLYHLPIDRPSPCRTFMNPGVSLSPTPALMNFASIYKAR